MLQKCFALSREGQYFYQEIAYCKYFGLALAIICKNKELNTGQYITDGHSFAKFQDPLFFMSHSHFCRKKREQNYQPGCSEASTSWVMEFQNLWSSKALFRAKLMVRIWARFQWIIVIFNTSFAPPLQYMMLKLRGAFLQMPFSTLFLNHKWNLKLFKQSLLCYCRLSIRGDNGKIRIWMLLNLRQLNLCRMANHQKASIRTVIFKLKGNQTLSKHL